MPKFVFYLHNENGAEPAVLGEMLHSTAAAECFGRNLLAERPQSIAVEVHSEYARITTIKQLGGGQTASAPSHGSPA